MGRYTTDGRITSLVTNMGPFPWEIIDLVQDCTMDLSTQQTSQLTVTILDPDLDLIGKGFCMEGSALALGGQFFQVRSRAMSMLGTQVGLQIVAYSEGICKMMDLDGALVRQNITPTDYIAADAKACGLRFFGQPTAKRASIVRSSDPTNPQDAWDVALQLAQEEGYWLFESANCVYFGKPSWLATHLPRYFVRWRGENTTDPIVTIPLMSSSLDNAQSGTTGTFTAEPESSEVFIPGVAIDLQGLGVGSGSFDGVYLVTGLALDLDGKTPGNVTLAQPLDPVPGDPGAVQKPPKSGGFQEQYPFVAPGPTSQKGWTWFAAGNIKGSTSAGISIYGSLGETIVAPAGGTVIKTSSSSGPAVRIAVDGSISVEITHMLAVTVRPGQVVGRGQSIGTMKATSGNDGYAHAQVFNGTVQVDPAPYFPVIA